jgi:tetratricopeptide repeat protein
MRNGSAVLTILLVAHVAAAKPEAKSLAALLLTASERGDLDAWTIEATELGDTTVVLVVKPGVVPRVGLVRGGKLAGSVRGASAASTDCDAMFGASVEPLDLGGKQHLRVAIACTQGEDCRSTSEATTLYRVEPDAAGLPVGLSPAWTGDGNTVAYAHGDCSEDASSCIALGKVKFTLSGDGKGLLVSTTSSIEYDGEPGDARLRKRCNPEAPRTAVKTVPYTLPAGGMTTVAVGDKSPEDAVTDERTTPAAAAKLLEDAKTLSPAGRHAFAVAGNSRGHRLFQAGNCAEAIPLLHAAAALDAKYGMPRYNAARCHAMTGDVEGAIRWLGELKALGKSQKKRLAGATTDPAFEKVALDPRFKALFQ